MANPDAILAGQGVAIDPVVGADGTVYMKAAGVSIAVTGAGDPSAPQLVTDFTMLTGTGAQVVAAGPTSTRLITASTPCRRVTVTPFIGNTNTLYVGLSTVTANTNNTTGGHQLQPGEHWTFGIDNVNKVYIHGTAGQGASFAYEL